MISLKLQRGDKKEIEINGLKLVRRSRRPADAFLGILPLRDDPEARRRDPLRLPEEARPTRPAQGRRPDREGRRRREAIRADDREASFRPRRKSDRTILDAPSPRRPRSSSNQAARRRQDRDGARPSSAAMTDDVPEQLPAGRHGQGRAAGKADNPESRSPMHRAEDGRQGQDAKDGRQGKKKDEKPRPKEGRDKKDDKKPRRRNGLHGAVHPAKDHKYWVYVPKNYDPNVQPRPGRLAARGRQRRQGREGHGRHLARSLRGPALILVGPKSRERRRLDGERGRIRARSGPRRDEGVHRSTASGWSPTAWASAGRWRSTSASTPAT